MINSGFVVPLSSNHEFSSNLLGSNGEPNGGEWLLLYNSNSTFYYMCTNDCDMESFCTRNDWHIISSCNFNEHITLGIGFRDKDQVEGMLYRVENEERLKIWSDILRFTFNQEYKELYFPYDNYFNGMIRLADSLCFYVHEYIPVSHKVTMTTEQRKIANMIFRFKEGHYVPFMIKVFTLAMERLRIITRNRKNTILIPIPAATTERNTSRFARLIQVVSDKLNIENGFDAITIHHDRNQLKGNTGFVDKCENLTFDTDKIKGKNIILIDDILTTGAGFIQTKRRLVELGAIAVTGVFLARTKEKQAD